MDNQTISYKYKQIIVDENGEIIFEEYLKNFLSKEKINKEILTKILLDEDISRENKIKKILQYLFAKKLINPENLDQIKLFNNYKYQKNLFEKIEEIINISKYFFRLFKNTSSFSNCIKKNLKTPCETWNDIYEILKIDKRETQQKFKNFCLKYFIIRQVTITLNDNKKNVRFYLNPCFYKNSDYIGSFVLYIFKDIIKENNSVNEFVIDLLKLKYE